MEKYKKTVEAIKMIVEFDPVEREMFYDELEKTNQKAAEEIKALVDLGRMFERKVE